MKLLCTLFAVVAAILVAAPARAQQPLYLVNGSERSDVAEIPPAMIERIEELPADEQTIARYGDKAAGGVVLITLKYDEPPRFGGDSITFGRYIADRVVWDETDPTARIVVRYHLSAEGELTGCEVLEATDARFRRRVLKAVAKAPRWEPARKNGSPVESEGILRLQLPEGRRMPRRMELVIRG